MTKKIIIDSYHPQETKFLVINGKSRIEDFEYQNINLKPIKGNIYLAKITKIEPALQAAFVEYGNEKKGFLPFDAIHPKYFQIQQEDKERLVEKIKNFSESEEASQYKSLASVKLHDYNIQEVLKKDQVMLVQVEKDERANKGATMTTYISLSGRYCVFSPNSLKRGVGISRKIEDPDDKERLKNLATELIHENKNSYLILRTAASFKGNEDVAKDFHYLQRVWGKIKEQVLKSLAPSLIYEEGDAIISGIKAHYGEDIDEIVISGEKAYEKAKKFIDVFISEDSQKVKKHDDLIPILHKYKLNKQLDLLWSNKVPLNSGGHLVINSTEALTVIDVNSGRYTDEYNIEETALNINLEAAREIAKQCKLRGIYGLIAIDFIDLEKEENRREVEKRVKRAFLYDSSRVNIGRISEFGVLEMSRQRKGRSFFEMSSKVCSNCKGEGRVTSWHSSALVALNEIRYYISSHPQKNICVFLPTDVLIYLINHYKQDISYLESENKITIALYVDDFLRAHENRISVDKNQQSTLEDEVYNRYFKPLKYAKPNNIVTKDYLNQKEVVAKQSKLISGGSKKILRKYKNTDDVSKEARSIHNTKNYKPKQPSFFKRILVNFIK